MFAAPVRSVRPEILFDVRPFAAKSASASATGRLGRALRTSRQRSGLSTSEVARRSQGWFLPRHVRDVESGRRRLNNDELRFLVSLYGTRLSEDLPARVSLRLVRVGPGERIESSDTVVARYLALVHALRTRRGDPGAGRPARLTLRDGDVTILSNGLGVAPERLRTAAVAIARRDRKEIEVLSARLRQEVRVQGSELLVGITAMGALVFEDRASSRRLERAS